MKKIIKGWVHRPGRHCASTIISDISFFYSANLTEAFCAGLGSALGFFYMESPALSPTRLIATRCAELEKNFFEAIGINFSWNIEKEPKIALEKIKKWIDKQVPIILKADIYYLDHYKSKTHFPGHVICVWGYDEEKNIVQIADTGWEGLLEIPVSSLEKARFSKTPFFPLNGEYFPVDTFQMPNDLVIRIRKAIAHQANELFNPGPGNKIWQGIKGMRACADSIPEWTKAEDSSWCFRWAYQIIERRGTGGGAFRKLYAEFLDEIKKFDSSFEKTAPPSQMFQIANNWTELSEIFKSASENPSSYQLAKQASSLLKKIADMEEKFFQGYLSSL